MLPKPKLLELENRSFQRHTCQWPALLVLRDIYRPCVIEDISKGGCGIKVKSATVQPGDTVVIRVASRKISFEGRVTWARGDEAGIKFTSKPIPLGASDESALNR